MNVNPGELNQRIELLEKQSQRTTGGYEVCQWCVVHRCWAKMTRTSGTELVKANGDFSETSVRFLLYCPSVPVSRKMAVRYRGAEYEITYVNDYGDAHAYMELWCKRLSLEG